MNDAKLLEEGRRLKNEIDGEYHTLYDTLSKLGAIKRSIRAKERALSSIQERLLTASGMAPPTATEGAARRRLFEARDDEDCTATTGQSAVMPGQRGG